MRIAVASGKGGTGKTTVACSLALRLSSRPGSGSDGRAPLLFLDCDVEAPNAHLILKPELEDRRPVQVPVPQVDPRRCSACGKCADVCQHHALAVVASTVLVFPELCHGCGSCVHVCPEAAITEAAHAVGALERGRAGKMGFARGILEVGQPMAGPVIRQLKRWAAPQDGQMTIVDAPPGTSCPVVEAVRGSDFLLLVTEPTPFGLHDLRLAVGMARQLALPAGVVLNRDGLGDRRVEEYCEAEGLPILLRIPHDRQIARTLAGGGSLLDIDPAFAVWMDRLAGAIAAVSGAAR
jgi:MinD superfamily P-loop ATPase